jgi:hypothetical protein
MSRWLSVKTLSVTYLAVVAILVSSSLASLAQTLESNPLEAYDGGVKYATIAVSSDWPWQCSNDGEQLVYINTRMGYVTRVDIASGDSRLLASYQRPERENTAISFSPDLGIVATTIPLKLTADAGKLKVILVQQNKRQNSKESVQQIRWSRDASRLAVAYDSTLVEILASGGKRVGSGERPKAWNVADGWFDVDREALTLFLVPEQQHTGIVVRCNLVSWKCNRLKSRVDSFSIGRRGIVGTMEPLGKAPMPDDDSIVFPPPLCSGSSASDLRAFSTASLRHIQRPAALRHERFPFWNTSSFDMEQRAIGRMWDRSGLVQMRSGNFDQSFEGT